jgi:hypothetical protein
MHDTLTTKPIFPSDATSAFQPAKTGIAKSARKNLDIDHMRALDQHSPQMSRQLGFILHTIYFAGAAAIGVMLIYYSFV